MYTGAGAGAEGGVGVGEGEGGGNGSHKKDLPRLQGFPQHPDTIFKKASWFSTLESTVAN